MPIQKRDNKKQVEHEQDDGSALDKLGRAIYRLETLISLTKATGNLGMLDHIKKHAMRMQHLHQQVLEETGE